MASSTCFFGPASHVCSCFRYGRWNNMKRGQMKFTSLNLVGWRPRRNLICAVNKDAEKLFKKTVEVDRLIDMLRDANDKELQQLVVENVLAFNEGFWIRLAARSETCKSEDDKKDYEELAAVVMSVVDCLVHKTKEKIESATDVLKAILKPVVNEEEEITWPPRDPETLVLMQNELNQREQEGQLDEGFLSEVNAQLRQAKEDGDKPGLEAMLQKVLQLYASRVLSKRSYAKKGNEVLKAEQFLETLIQGTLNSVSIQSQNEEIVLWLRLPNVRFMICLMTSCKFDETHAEVLDVASLLLCISSFRIMLIERGFTYLMDEPISLCRAPETEWNKLLLDGLTIGKGDVSPEDLTAVTKKRIERVLIRTEGGSYQQRVLIEYLKGIQARGEEIVNVLQGGST